MSRRLIAAAVLSLMLMARGIAAPPAPAPALERLVEQLGDSDFRKRDEAARRLEAEGTAAVPALKKALGHTDAEVRRRVQGLLPRLELAAFVAPRHVTLKATDKPLRAICDEITRQTGYKVEFWTQPDRANQVFSCDFKDVSFWQALDRLCRDANLVVQQNYGDQRVILQSQGGHVPHVAYEGAFRFVPTGFQMHRQLEFGLDGGAGALPQRHETLTLSFLVFSEPRIPMLGMGEVRLAAAYDSHKNTMLPPIVAADPAQGAMFPGGAMPFGIVRQRFTSRYGNGNRSFMQQGQLTLHRPSETASRVKLVRGSIPVTLLVEQKPVVVADNILKAKGKKATIGTTSFRFEDVTVQPNKQCQVKVNISEDNKDNPNDWTWMNTMYQRIELQDDRGQKFGVFGTSWGNSSPNNVLMTLTYGAQGNAKLGPPSKFVFHYWKTIPHQVNFEFKDLPLP